MQGKISMRFNMPNVQRFRSRVENPSKELTSEVRDALQKVVCEVLNGQQLQIRAKMIETVNGMNLKYKSAAHAAKVNSVMESFFDTFFARTPEELAELVGVETDEETKEEIDQESDSEETNAESDEFED